MDQADNDKYVTTEKMEVQSKLETIEIVHDCDEKFEEIVAKVDRDKLHTYMEAVKTRLGYEEQAIKSKALKDPEVFISNFTKWSEMQKVG